MGGEDGFWARKFRKVVIFSTQEEHKEEAAADDPGTMWDLGADEKAASGLRQC